MTRRTGMRRRIDKAATIPVLSWRRRRAIAAEACIWLAVARLCLLCLPFRHAMRLVSGQDASLVDGSRILKARTFAAYMTRAAGFVPFRAKCIEQALGLHFMLRVRGVPSVLHYGIATSPGIRAHVWLSVGPEVVLGDDGRDEFCAVASFPIRE